MNLNESMPKKISEEALPPVVGLTERAIEHIRQFPQKTQTAQGKLFRVYVEGGGCSGLQYGFSFDEKKDDDVVLTFGDTSILVDPQSILYLRGSVVDYVEDLRGSGFSVKNPNSKGSCGCGVSFTV